jgi:alpha-glucosidase
MHGTLRFWLERGVDGFRIDVVHCLGKDPALPDNPPELAGIPMSALNDHPASHAIIRDLRAVAEAYPGERVLVGEVYLLSTTQVARYYGHGDELHLAFNFPPLYAPWEAAAWRTSIDAVAAELDRRDAWPTWVLSNHDNQRHRTRYGSEARGRAAAVLLLTLRGTPFLYAGEELGLEDAVIPPDRVRDPGGRDGCRAPIPWAPAPDHGWGVRDAWLPWPPEPERRNAESLRADGRSILHLYRRLLAVRRRSPALRLGGWRPLIVPEGTLGYERAHAGDRRRVLINFTGEDVAVPLEGVWMVDVASDGAGEGGPYGGRLAADQAVVLRPEAPES